MNNNICYVGYALNSKKMRQSDCSSKEWTGGGLADIINDESQHKQGVKFIPWINSQYYNTNNYNIIIHKLTDTNDSKINELVDYLSNHPEIKLIDPIQSIYNVISRNTTNQLLNRLIINSLPNCPFTIPSYFTLDQPIGSSQELLDRMKEVHMLFPIICKPIEACGTPISHQLVVIVNSCDYHLIQSPCVVQQYFNHNSRLYKVYVMDDDVDIFERSSLPDLTTDIKKLKSVAFDSRNHYPTINDFSMHDNFTTNQIDINSIENTNHLLTVYRDQFEATAKLISKEFGLSLFGFDVIIPTNIVNTNMYQTNYERIHSIEQKVGFDNSYDQLGPLVVIDVNYFPSYKEVGDFPDRLRAFLRKKAGFSVYVDSNNDNTKS